MTTNVNTRSDILVHWTGRDIDSDAKASKRPWQVTAQDYVARFVGLLKYGLWLTEFEEEFDFNNKSSWKYKTTAVCFTELRLSHVSAHSKRYGRLGIGFSRDFVRRNGGAPVHYLPIGHKDSMASDPRNFAQYHLKSYLKPMGAQTQTVLGSGSGFLHYYYMDEHEWRIANHPGAKNLREPALGDELASKRNCKKLLPIKPGDIRIVIFPNRSTRQWALGNETVKKILKHVRLSSVLLDDCPNF